MSMLLGQTLLDRDNEVDLVPKPILTPSSEASSRAEPLLLSNGTEDTKYEFSFFIIAMDENRSKGLPFQLAVFGFSLNEFLMSHPLNVW
jgi:hypothetical protein